MGIPVLAPTIGDYPFYSELSSDHECKVCIWILSSALRTYIPIYQVVLGIKALQ